MGQRSQIIVKLPKYYINEDNPNNREEEFLIYHNQWLYGYGFIKHLVEIMQLFNQYKKYYINSELKQFTPNYREFITNAINCANYKDVKNIRKTHLYGLEEDTRNDNNFIANTCNNWNELFNRLDNNNGFIFIDINNKGVISYDVVNGLEDSDIHKRRTGIEYLKLFFNDSELEANKKDIDKLLKELYKFKRVDYRKIKLPNKTQKKFSCKVKELNIFAKDKQEATDKAMKQIKELSPYFITLKEVV